MHVVKLWGEAGRSHRESTQTRSEDMQTQPSFWATAVAIWQGSREMKTMSPSFQHNWEKQLDLILLSLLVSICKCVFLECVLNKTQSFCFQSSMLPVWCATLLMQADVWVTCGCTPGKAFTASLKILRKAYSFLFFFFYKYMNKMCSL